ncbi:MAG TPA: hypothetical protein VF704_10775 [Allosphingosinicella sp.]|jgi:hypothetical protein
MFFRGSRYEAVPDAEIAGPDGRTIRYKRQRFIPELEPGPAFYVVREGDRPDLMAHALLGDAEAFWRLCDLNRTIRPVDLAAAPGTRIARPSPEGGM